MRPRSEIPDRGFVWNSKGILKSRLWIPDREWNARSESVPIGSSPDRKQSRSETVPIVVSYEKVFWDPDRVYPIGTSSGKEKIIKCTTSGCSRSGFRLERSFLDPNRVYPIGASCGMKIENARSEVSIGSSHDWDLAIWIEKLLIEVGSNVQIR